MKSPKLPKTVCELCDGHGYGGPCHEAIILVKDGLLSYLDKMFAKKMQEFQDFIENDLEIEN